MSSPQTIAKLVASLGFQVEDKQLDSFLIKLGKTVDILKQFKTVASAGIKFKVGVDKTALTAIKTDLAALGKQTIKFSDVKLTEKALRAMRVQVNTALGESVVRIASVKPIPTKDLTAIQRQVTNSLKNVNAVGVPIKVDPKKLTADLRAWGKQVRDTFNYKVKLGVSKQALYKSLKEAVDHAGGLVSTIKLKDPKVKIGIDKVHLKTEIRDALAQIKKEVRIKMDLTGHGSPSGGRVGAGSISGWRGAAAGGILGGAMGMGRGFIPGLGGAFAVAQLSNMSQQMQGQRAAMTAVTGSQTAGGETMGRLRGMANEIGFSWRDVAPQFTKMIASGTSAGMGQGEVETIFKSVSEYGRVMGLDSEAMKGSFTAIEQMMNKQQIYAEELKTQLGERFPAAISMMAEAVSRKQGKEVTVPELMALMKEGKVDSSVLKEFAQIASERARKGGALDIAKQSSAAQQGRFNNSWSALVEKFSDAGFDKIMQEFWKSAADGLDILANGAKGLAVVFETLMRPVLAFINILKNMGPLVDGIEPKFAALVAVAGLLAFPLTSTATALALIALGIEDIMVWSQGGDSLFGKLFEGLNPETQARLINLGTMFKQAGQDISTAFSSIGSALNDLGIDWGEISGGLLNSMIERLTRVAAYVSSISKMMTALSTKDWAGASSAAGDVGALALEGTPLHWLLKPEYREDITNRVNELTGKGNTANLERGLGYLQQSGMSSNGNGTVTGKVTSGNQEINISLKMTTDEISASSVDGTLPTKLEAAIKRTVKEHFAHDLGGVGARLMNYD